ncbi:hypothetical protein SDC9_22084 [bioreactor metagenome]|uniref:Uncharacterized protein n=1 Tax=bioreactor metagenome TaxID=1076179 RepID=A0A644UBK4_9ZZZZ|nr:hypothetical protein [Desulfitobacterium hafniense]MEA5022110.1 hypothetical protein [Desulfitobacterium hafniense]
MQIKDYITITISSIALLFSFCSVLFTFLNFRRTEPRLEIEQLKFSPNPLATKVRPNMLYLDGIQNPDLWTVVPMFYLIIYVKINNLSHTGITISNFIINNKFLVSKLNTVEIEKELPLKYFASKESESRDLKNYGHAVPMSFTALRHDDYDFINVGNRIEAKSSIEGAIIIPGNQSLYVAVDEGINKLTIVTPDKKFDTYIKIDKTVIPSNS